MSDSNDTREGWTGIGKWWYAAAALVAVVAIGFVLVILLPDPDKSTGTSNPTTGSTPTSTPPSSPATTPSSPAANSGWEAAGCNGNPGNDQIPSDAPEAEWEPLGGSSIPVSDTYGPARVNHPLRQCFQHSPTGAVFAVATIMTSIGAEPENAGTIARAAIAPGPGRDDAIRQADGASSSVSQTVAAYHVTSCTPPRCNVDMVFSISGGQLVRTALSAVWSGEDWQLDAAALEAAGAASVPQVPPGFTTWAPGR